MLAEYSVYFSYFQIQKLLLRVVEEKKKKNANKMCVERIIRNKKKKIIKSSNAPKPNFSVLANFRGKH
jgi:hypothetical protein